MEGYKLNSLGQAQLYQKTYASPVVDSSFKVDEGYSEETRSQDDVDSAMRLDPRTNEITVMRAPMVAGLPEGIMALSEAERSGMLKLSWNVRYR